MAFLPSLFTSLLLAVIIPTLFLWNSRNRQRLLNLPPGPPKDLFIGHLRYMPTIKSAHVFHAWAQTYGPVMHLQVLGQSLVILDTQQAAADLLEARSSIYSDRPEFPLYDILGWTHILSFMRYDKLYVKHRQAHQSFLSRQNVAELRPMQTDEARRLVSGMIDSPPEKYAFLLSRCYSWLNHLHVSLICHRFSTSTTTQIMAGHQIISEGDPYLRLSKMVYEAFARTGPPGGSAIDLFPILRYFPSWFPGAYYAGVAREWKPAVRELYYNAPLETVQRQRESGNALPSFILSHLEKIDNGTPLFDVEELKGAGATIFSAGEATTWSGLTFFILAMVLHPEYQARAQKEIDSITGRSRLPEFGDRDSLPLVVVGNLHHVLAILTITTGLPHRSTEDDIYLGMHIPKGSLVFANIRGMSLDENIYKNAASFLPERFLPPPAGNGEPHFSSVFGFGRRCAPPEFARVVTLADDSLWIAIASILATCTISPTLDEHGNAIKPEVLMPTD
ncbi:cytochrome P450 [Mycena crocata]|nr:cytochrome P450 [Mycena crocata]